MNSKFHGDSISERDSFIHKLKELHIFSFTDSDLLAKASKRAPGTIESLSEKEFTRFMEILKEVTA